MDKEKLLGFYGALWGPEAGPFNLSVEGKYLEYMLTRFFEENFTVDGNSDICNIGIGAGFWDRYLSYKLRDGTLTSVDRLPECCDALRDGLLNEGNYSHVNVICSDVTALEGFDESFDLVTVVGSTVRESGLGGDLVEKALTMVKPGGSFYLQTIIDGPEGYHLDGICQRLGAVIDGTLYDPSYGFEARYFKITRR